MPEGRVVFLAQSQLGRGGVGIAARNCGARGSVSANPCRTNPETIPSCAMNYRDIITIEPGKRSGKPCIRGTRMTVTDVLEYLASGMSHQELLAEFPDLTETDIRACLAFAADRERKLAALPAA